MAKIKTPSELGTFDFPQSACIDDLIYRMCFGFRIVPPLAHCPGEWRYRTLGGTLSKVFMSKQEVRAAMRADDHDSYYWEAHRNGLCQ